MTVAYKHAASVTGQVYFCAAPIRIDAYDGCQFACVYCFSRRRSRVSAANGVHAADPHSLERRLQRVKVGELASALDEFLAARVPIQLGGLHDPFTPREQRLGVTLAILTTLQRHHYPTLVSTKGDLVLTEPYPSILRDMNVLVRFSAAGVQESFRAGIDRGCAGFDQTLDRIQRLSRLGIATGLRIQPVIPGFEADALTMTRRAANAGVRQVSFEYLKLPSESVEVIARQLKAITGRDIYSQMQVLGATRLGWDYVLPAVAKKDFVIESRKTCRRLGVRFGAGDTEFIPWSDGEGCCGSSNDWLLGARQFQTNLVGAIKAAVARGNQSVTFAQVRRGWSPIRPISTYLNRRSRARVKNRRLTDWLSLMAYRWNGSSGPYSPDFFEGVTWTGKTDRDGMRTYDVSALARALRT